MTTTQRGRVAAYRASRGFGFITPDHNCGDLFVQAGDVEDDGVALVPGQAVEYQPRVGEAGQLVAVAVRPLDRKNRRRKGDVPLQQSSKRHL